MNLILGRGWSYEIKRQQFAQALSPTSAIRGLASAAEVLISYKLTENKPRLPGPLAHLRAGRSLSCNSTEAPNLTLSNCNSSLLAIKITLGQLRLLPPAPHVQFCLENTGGKRSPGCESLPFVGRCQHQVGSGGSGGARCYPNLRCLNVNTNALHAGIFFFSPPPQAQKTDEGAANGGLAGPISRDLGSIQTLLGIAEKPWISSCLPLPAPLIYRHTQWAQVEPGPKQEFCLSRRQGSGTGHGNPP